VHRSITGFHQDDDGDWVAELTCLHRQHVRHRPPFRQRPWVTKQEGRAEHLGTELDCPLCERAELPEGLGRIRVAGPFTDETLPAGLRLAHRVAAGTWGVLRVLDGALEVSLGTHPPIERRMGPGEAQPLPPDVVHHLALIGTVRLEIDFLIRP
jgi:tellurite methyltransferase